MDIHPDSERGEPRLSCHIQGDIGRQLRAMYKDVVEQGVPERLVALVRRLDDEIDPKDEE
jgi:hypothetical protein